MSASTLPILLRSLGLTTLARDYPEAITRAEADNWGYLRFLHQLTEGELNGKRRFGCPLDRFVNTGTTSAGGGFPVDTRATIPAPATVRAARDADRRRWSWPADG